MSTEREGFDEWVLRSKDYGATEEEGSRLLWDLWQAACKWEREECAKVCDRFAARGMHPAECAGVIRMRSGV